MDRARAGTAALGGVGARARRIAGAERADVREEVAIDVVHAVAIGNLPADLRAALDAEIVGDARPAGVEVGSWCHRERQLAARRTGAVRRALARAQRVVGAVAELARLPLVVAADRR